MPTNIPRPLPKPGEPGYQEPGVPRLASPPPPRKRYDNSGRIQPVVISEIQDKLARSDERKRMLLERVVRIFTPLSGNDVTATGLLLDEIKAELSRG